jgi:ADP-heptose:LPS heptosyltransferase
VALDFHAIARSAALGALSGAPMRVGYARPYAREGADRLATHRVRLAQRPVSRFDRNEALVRSLVGPGTPRSTPPLEVAPAAREAMAAQLGDGLRPVILHPGSSAAAAYKRWPPHRFAQLARALAGEGERVLVSRGPAAQERAIAREVVEASSGAAALAPETTGFEALAALLAAGRAVVAADSGPLHVASLVGTPVVQLVGPTDEVENEPWRETPFARVVTGLACRGCRSGCAAAACMQGIEARAVRRALRRLMAPPGRRLQLVSVPTQGA